MLICRADYILDLLFLEIVEERAHPDGGSHRETLIAEYCRVAAGDPRSRGDLLGALGERLMSLSTDESDYLDRAESRPVLIDDTSDLPRGRHRA
jgi:hypothetical protein